jgi:hypothetical protein
MQRPPWSPHRRDARLLFTRLHDQANAPVGIPTTTGGCSSSAVSGGASADSTSIRTSEAGVVDDLIAAWDTDIHLDVSDFM